VVLSSNQYVFPAEENQKNLAGQARFPAKAHKEWLEVQKNPAIDPASKIKCTIDTFLILKYESLKEGSLFDFGFLFNLSDEQGETEYANERGLLFLRIVGYRALGGLIEHYDYRPRYKDIKIEGKLAKVIMHSSDQIVSSNSPDRAHNFGWGGYTISLKDIDSHWLINHLDCEDETYIKHPLGTDFLPEAKRILENNLTHEEFTTTPSEVLQKQKEQALSYAEITGKYMFETDEGKILVGFGLIDTRLVAKFDEYAVGVRLIPLRRKDLAFSAISPTGVIYDLQFLKDNLDNLTKCRMKILDKQHTGLKTDDSSELDPSLPIFTGYNKDLYAKMEAEVRRMDTDLDYKKFIEERKRRLQETFAVQRQETENRIRIYHEISGEYRFEMDGRLVSISFYVQDRFLVGIYDRSAKSVILQIIKESPLEFEFRPQDNVVYSLRFEPSEEGDIKKCFIKSDNQWYEGQKVDKLKR
jgi:hypothetical protein